MNNPKLLYITLITSIIALSFVQCDNNPKSKKTMPKTQSQRTELKEVRYSFDNPPQFRHDGELNFIDKDNQVTFTIDIEIASTDMERALGLMFRPKMEENKGMLFLMDREEMQSFYMRNTIIPLDIIYVNSKFEIVDIYENTNTLDDTSLPSHAPAKYVVEINAGLCEKHGIKIGDSIYF